MKKGTQIRRCPACGVHTASLVPTGEQSPIGPVFRMIEKANCHKPVCEILHHNRYDPVPRSQFPLPGYFCEDCFQRIGRESDQRAAAARANK